MALTLNSITLFGRIGNDPDYKQLDGGKQVATLSLATDSGFYDKTSGSWKENTQWHKLVLWANNADYANKNIKKGELVGVQGELRYNTYEDKEGIKRTSAEIHVYRVIHNVSKGNSGSGESNDAPF